MKKLSTRFALLLAAAAVVPLLAYGAVSMTSVSGGTRDALISANTDHARRTAEQIRLYVTTSVRILTALAAELQQTGLARWQQDRILKNYVLEFPEFRELTLIDENGLPLVSSQLEGPTTSLPGSDSIEVLGALMSRFYLDDDFLPTSVVAIRIGNGEGWLIGRLNLEELWRTVDRIRVGEDGFALVVTSDGQLLAHGNPVAKPGIARNENLGAHPLVTRVRDAQLSPEGVASEQYDSERGRMLGVAAQIPDLGWTVIVEQPVSEAFAVPIELQRELGVSIALALMAMLTVGYFWGRRFIRPIQNLTRGTRALAEGRLDERVAVESTDELGQLAVAFNNMAARLVELQEDVRKKERQAMFGRLSVGLVHDLSHPLQNIGNSCKLMVRMWDDLEYRETFARTVDREMAQVKRVLDDLRNVARPVPIERFPIDVNKVLAELVESMQTTAASASLSLETELVFGPLYVAGDLFALNRVFGNLITNAMQATMARGRVVVRTMRQDEHAVIEVADTGTGIAPERLDTIFDDFVTTRRRGLGLGLAISKRTVEQLGGTIAVASQMGVGSTFTLRFPLTKSRPSQLAAV